MVEYKERPKATARKDGSHKSTTKVAPSRHPARSNPSSPAEVSTNLMVQPHGLGRVPDNTESVDSSPNRILEPTSPLGKELQIDFSLGLRAGSIRTGGGRPRLSDLLSNLDSPGESARWNTAAKGNESPEFTEKSEFRTTDFTDLACSTSSLVISPSTVKINNSSSWSARKSPSIRTKSANSYTRRQDNVSNETPSLVPHHRVGSTRREYESSVVKRDSVSSVQTPRETIDRAGVNRRSESNLIISPSTRGSNSMVSAASWSSMVGDQSTEEVSPSRSNIMKGLSFTRQSRAHKSETPRTQIENPKVYNNSAAVQSPIYDTSGVVEGKNQSIREDFFSKGDLNQNKGRIFSQVSFRKVYSPEGKASDQAEYSLNSSVKREDSNRSEALALPQYYNYTTTSPRSQQHDDLTRRDSVASGKESSGICESSILHSPRSMDDSVATPIFSECEDLRLVQPKHSSPTTRAQNGSFSSSSKSFRRQLLAHSNASKHSDESMVSDTSFHKSSAPLKIIPYKAGSFTIQQHKKNNHNPAESPRTRHYVVNLDASFDRIDQSGTESKAPSKVNSPRLRSPRMHSEKGQAIHSNLQANTVASSSGSRKEDANGQAKSANSCTRRQDNVSNETPSLVPHHRVGSILSGLVHSDVKRDSVSSVQTPRETIDRAGVNRRSESNLIISPSTRGSNSMVSAASWSSMVGDQSTEEVSPSRSNIMKGLSFTRQSRAHKSETPLAAHHRQNLSAILSQIGTKSRSNTSGSFRSRQGAMNLSSSDEMSGEYEKSPQMSPREQIRLSNEIQWLNMQSQELNAEKLKLLEELAHLRASEQSVQARFVELRAEISKMEDAIQSARLHDGESSYHSLLARKKALEIQSRTTQIRKEQKLALVHEAGRRIRARQEERRNWLDHMKRDKFIGIDSMHRILQKISCRVQGITSGTLLKRAEEINQISEEREDLLLTLSNRYRTLQLANQSLTQDLRQQQHTYRDAYPSLQEDLLARAREIHQKYHSHRIVLKKQLSQCIRKQEELLFHVRRCPSTRKTMRSRSPTLLYTTPTKRGAEGTGRSHSSTGGTNEHILPEGYQPSRGSPIGWTPPSGPNSTGRRSLSRSANDQERLARIEQRHREHVESNSARKALLATLNSPAKNKTLQDTQLRLEVMERHIRDYVSYAQNCKAGWEKSVNSKLEMLSRETEYVRSLGQQVERKQLQALELQAKLAKLNYDTNPVYAAKVHAMEQVKARSISNMNNFVAGPTFEKK